METLWKHLGHNDINYSYFNREIKLSVYWVNHRETTAGSGFGVYHTEQNSDLATVIRLGQKRPALVLG